MTNGYDTSALAGQVYPIVGAGISLGILAHTARGVTETMFPSRHSRRNIRRPARQRTPPRRRPYRQPPYRPQQRQRRPQYGYWRD